MAPIDRARPLTGAPADYDPLLERASESHLVLFGEASHGTHEFYRERAEITKRLITSRASRPWRSKPTGPTPTA
jgi:erythromycin esterase-like protein